MPKTAAAKKNTAPDFMATITGNAKVADKKVASKAKDGIITDAPQNVKEDITALIAAKKTAKIAKATITQKEASVIEFGKAHKDAQAFNANFNKSYKIQGEGDDTVTFVTANKFSFSTDDVPEIEEILEDSDIELDTKYVVTVKGEVFTDEAKQKELMALLGDRWTDFFDTTVVKTVPTDFDKKIYGLGKDKKDDLEVLMKQSKPSVR